jgi:basic amino acid/polyamine antiporter, APA family
MIWLSGSTAAGGILAAAIDQIAPFVPWVQQPLVRAGLIIGVCAAFGFMASKGARTSARAIELTMLIKLTPLVIFVVVVLALAPAAPIAAAPSPTLGAALPVLVLGIYLFAGLESAIVVNGEVRNPARSIPLGLFMAISVFTIVAAAIQYAAAHALGAALPDARAPLVLAGAKAAGWLPVMIAAAAVASMLGCVAGLAVAIPRTILAFADDGLLPAALRRIDPRHATPTRAIVLHAVIAATFAIAGQFATLAVAASLASMAVYIVGCTAVLVLRQRRIAQSRDAMNWPITPIAAGIAIIANLLVIGSAGMNAIGTLLASIAVFACLVPASRALNRQKAGAPE